jgi:hypothetical protein
MNETEKDKSLNDNVAGKLADNLSLTTEYVSLKASKLTAALYLVTSNLSDHDPLKWRLRKLALDVLSQTKLAVSRPLESGACLFDRSIDSMSQLLSLLEIGLLPSGVSQMNFSILRNEYANLQEKMSRLNGVAVSLETTPPPPALTAGPGSKIKRTEAKTEPGRLNSRQDTIIKFLEENGWSSIKDISRVLPEVSAKTVQRDLSDLVTKGKLEREGDRRWSRYQVASSLTQP